MECLYMSLYREQLYFHLKQDGSSMEFEVEGAEDAQITVEMEADTEYEYFH